jgi:2-C-methyl-D-erythritol 4-phosphate cytidylyltransferase
MRPSARPLTAAALIAAAGSGERLGAGGPKALVEIAGRPLIGWCVAAFAASRTIRSVIVAAPRDHVEELARQVPRSLPGLTAIDVVAGGASRSESVAAALARIEGPQPADERDRGGDGPSGAELFVAVHDAARPLVTAELIDACVAKLASRPDADAVIAAVPVTDTIKRAREPRPAKGDHPRGGPTVSKTESRDHLWAAQTPQVFRAAALRDAHAADPQRVAAATDDAMLVERAGGKVLIEAAPAENLKVTTPTDLRFAEALLGDRDAGRPGTSGR